MCSRVSQSEVKVCLEPCCPTLTDQRRCTQHQRAADKARGTKRERGYDAEFQRIRRSIVKKIKAGEIVRCWRCGVRLGLSFHLDHNAARDGYRGPACAACNLHLAGKAAHRGGGDPPRG